MAMTETLPRSAPGQVGAKVPVVVRLEGTNVDEGRRLLSEAGMSFKLADGMLDAAQQVVALARKQ